jgi:hypothetical protein
MENSAPNKTVLPKKTRAKRKKGYSELIELLSFISDNTKVVEFSIDNISVKFDRSQPTPKPSMLMEPTSASREAIPGPFSFNDVDSLFNGRMRG